MKADIVLKKELLKGNDGGYYVPQVDAEYNLSFNPSLDKMPQVESTNLKGILTQSEEYKGIFAAEESRQQAEQQRQEAEASREAAEVERTAAEETRKAAEIEREATKEKAEAAATNAEAAAEAAINATSSLLDAAHANAITPEASGALVNITDAAAQPAVNLVSHIEPQQAGSGEPSPDNVRPISGWDGVEVKRTGKNLIGAPSATLDGYNEYQLTPLLPAGTYTLSAIVSTNDTDDTKSMLRISELDGKTQYLYFLRTGKIESLTFTTVNKLNKIRICASNSVANSSGDMLTIDKLQLESGSTATPYEPYQAQTLTAELPEAVYGGSLDWNTGVLTVNKYGIILDGTENYINDNGGEISLRLSVKAIDNKNKVNCICSMYQGRNRYNTYDNRNIDGWRGVSVNNYHIRFVDNVNVKNDINIFRDLLAAKYAEGTPVIVVYELAEPYTIQLTPQQLETLKGTNNIWSDCGSTDITYIADTKLYIDNKFNELTNAIISLGGNV